VDVVEVVEMKLKLRIDKTLFGFAANASPFRGHLSRKTAEVAGLGKSAEPTRTEYIFQ
jgi:hypothetical protein